MGKKLYAELDNTMVNKPQVIPAKVKMKEPSQELQEQMKALGYVWSGNNWRYTGTITQGKGKPSTDDRTSAQRNADYWHWWKGAKDRWTTSWNTGTNPVRASLDAGLGYANPATAVPSAIYDAYNAYDMLSSPNGLAKTWGLVKHGKIGKAAMSAAGDMMAAADLIPGMPEIPNTRSATRSATRQLTSNLPRLAGLLPSSQTYSGNPLGLAISNVRNNLASYLNSEYINALLDNIADGDMYSVGLLKGIIPDEQLINIANNFPDAKYVGAFDPNNIYRWYHKLNDVNSVRNGSIDAFVRLINANPYSDNPIYLEFKDKFPNIRTYDTSIRSAIEGPRTVENNQAIVDYLTANPNIHHYVPNYDVSRLLANILANHRNGMPAEYVHINTTTPYDGSYPVHFYRGSYATENVDKATMLENGLLARRADNGVPAITGLFTDADLKGLSPKQLKNFITRSQSVVAEGSHGGPYLGGTPTNFLDYLLTRDQTSRKDMEDLLEDINRVVSSGYTPSIHSLSFDSFPIYEKLLLNRINKGLAVPVTNLQLQAMGVPHEYINNSLGTVAKYEASPELLESLKTSYKPKVTNNGYIPTTDTEITKYQIENSEDPNIFKVSFDGNPLGTFRLRTSEELMNMLNESRRKLYRKNMDIYPGDMTPSEYADYFYNIPIITAITKKKGGKLNVRLVKKKR